MWSPDAVPPTDVINRVGVRWIDQAAAAAANGGDVELSIERAGELDCDLMFIVTAFLPADAQQPEDIPVFAGLNVVQRGQVVKIDRSYFGVNYRTYAELARHLAAAVKSLGDVDTDLV